MQEEPKPVKHPLSGNIFDYLGFPTEQKVIDDMHGNNKIGFNYESKFITFGNDVRSWDYEKLELLLYEVTENDFRYDDEFEKTFKCGVS